MIILFNPLTALWISAWMLHITPKDAWYAFPLVMSIAMYFAASVMYAMYYLEYGDE